MISKDEAIDLAQPLGGDGFRYGDAQGDVRLAFARAVIEQHENRRAAADDLYAALAALINDFGDADGVLIDNAKAALAKARGETQ